MKSNQKALGPFFLLLTALLWGVAFVAQEVGMDAVGPFTFNGARTLLGAVSLLPVLLVRRAVEKKRSPGTQPKEERAGKKKLQIRAGIVCGVVMFIASNLQQNAFVYSSAGKIAFITALYILFVPVIGLFLRKKVRPFMWLCFAVGLAGLYLLCVTDGFAGINRGDWLALGCSVAFSVHILVIDHYANRVDVVGMSCIQFFVAGLLALICAFVFEAPTRSGIAAAAIPILYTGILSCGVAYTLQAVGQKYTSAAVATLLLCMESVFGAVASAILLKEVMDVREVVGCALMFAAIILSQLPARGRKHRVA